MQLTVLVVDDDAGVRRSLLRLLRSHGHVAIGARDEAEALQRALAHRPAVILMDLLLQAGSGIDAAHSLRQHPDLADVPIIALSASPDVAERDAALFQLVLIKPCSTQALLRAIKSVCP